MANYLKTAKAANNKITRASTRLAECVTGHHKRQKWIHCCHRSRIEI